MEAKWKDTWDYLGWQDRNTVAEVWTQSDWNQTLLTKLNQVSINIHKATYRGGANVIKMHPKAYTIIKKLDYYHLHGNTLGSRYRVIVDEKLPLDKIYLIYEDEILKKIQAKDPNMTMCVIKKHSSVPNEMDEISIQILDKNSSLYEEALLDKDKTILEGPVVVGEVTILNHHTFDPISGELLIDYHMEVPQEIWSPTPIVDIGESDILYHRQASLLENAMILASGPNQQPKKTFIVPVGVKKPWYKKIMEIFKTN